VDCKYLCDDVRVVIDLVEHYVGVGLVPESAVKLTTAPSAISKPIEACAFTHRLTRTRSETICATRPACIVKSGRGFAGVFHKSAGDTGAEGGAHRRRATSRGLARLIAQILGFG
jgi:hypothetical protein